MGPGVIRRTLLRWCGYDAPPPPHFVAARAGRWPKVRALYLELHHQCAACGCVEAAALEVHHVAPVHVRPDLELDETNLITLCNERGQNCHFRIGHALAWAGWNADVRADAARFRSAVAISRQLALRYIGK